jgi:hypothetical protein
MTSSVRTTTRLALKNRGKFFRIFVTPFARFGAISRMAFNSTAVGARRR